MHISNDLVYKLMLSNTTDQRVMYKITFEDLGEDVNLRWPINGIKGSLHPEENACVALLPKILPGQETQANGKFEMEKLKVNLTWKAQEDQVVIA